MDKTVSMVKKLLRDAGTAEVRESSRRFFKDSQKIKFHGVKSAEVRKIAKQGLAALKGVDKETLFGLCEELWKSGFLEEGGVACEWAHAQRKHFVPSDLSVFGRWIERYIDNWASCDTLCNHTVGDLVTMYPKLVGELLHWTASPNRWKKRAAAVSLIIPARKGLFLENVLAIADRLLGSPDDMVQKGYGWALKAAGEAHPDVVYSYLVKNHEVMPRTAFRYALEKLPEDLRKKAMAL